MVLEYLSGGDLMTHLIRLDVFPIEMARFYGAELALAVDYLHQALGYAHRDIKPDNCVLSRTGHLKLLDFGLSKKLRIYYTKPIYIVYTYLRY
jgi:serine/threonine protein kinase